LRHECVICKVNTEALSTMRDAGRFLKYFRMLLWI